VYPRWALVVPPESLVNIRRATDVVARRIAVTPKNVDKAQARAFRDKHGGMLRASRSAERSGRMACEVRRSWVIVADTGTQKLKSAFARSAGYGETDFARGRLAQQVGAEGARPRRSSPERRAKSGWVFGTISAIGSSVPPELVVPTISWINSARAGGGGPSALDIVARWQGQRRRDLQRRPPRADEPHTRLRGP
jgi:hypothetical protein